MSSEEPARTKQIVTSTLPLFAATALSVIYYPPLAIRIDELIGGAGGSGSSLGYFRNFYVLPGALVFLVVSGVVLSLAARRGHRALLATTVAVWSVLLVGLLGSVEWYYHAVRAASELR
jgi:hypothetical protein